MSRLMWGKLASSAYAQLPHEQQLSLDRLLAHIRARPDSGRRLYGSEALYSLESPAGALVVYRLHGDDVQVLALDVPEYVPPPRRRMSAIILAAGRSPRQDAPSVLGAADVFLSAGVDEVVVVLGYDAERAKSVLAGKNVRVVVNPEYEHGISTSLRRGLRMLPRNTAGVMISLGNLALTRLDIVSRLIDTYMSGDAPIVVPIHSDLTGHPVIFDSSLIPDLLRARGNVGGRKVIEKHRGEARLVEVEDDCILRQIDDIQGG
jgi:molybdenum cofactor cytidylyltransferase